MDSINANANPDVGTPGNPEVLPPEILNTAATVGKQQAALRIGAGLCLILAVVVGIRNFSVWLEAGVTFVIAACALYTAWWLWRKSTGASR